MQIREMEELGEAEIRFNYLGPVDGVLRGEGLWAGRGETRQGAEREEPAAVCCRRERDGIGGRLHIRLELRRRAA